MCPVRLYTFCSAALARVTSVTLHRNVWSTRFAVARFCLSFNSFERRRAPDTPEGPGERSRETRLDSETRDSDEHSPHRAHARRALVTCALVCSECGHVCGRVTQVSAWLRLALWLVVECAVCGYHLSDSPRTSIRPPDRHDTYAK